MQRGDRLRALATKPYVRVRSQGVRRSRSRLMSHRTPVKIPVTAGEVVCSGYFLAPLLGAQLGHSDADVAEIRMGLKPGD